MNVMRISTLLLLIALCLFTQVGCISLPKHVADELEPAAADQPNNFRKPK